MPFNMGFLKSAFIACRRGTGGPVDRLGIRALAAALLAALFFLAGETAALAGDPPEVEWRKTFGPGKYNYGSFVRQTADGGYIIAGCTRSSYGDPGDAYLVKTDAAGNKTWEKTFGGTKGDSANSVWQTGDGGYIITGVTDEDSDHGSVYLLKTDAGGSIMWEKAFGGKVRFACGNSVRQTSEGGYIIAGTTDTVNASLNVCLIKTDSSGSVIWEKNFGRDRVEEGQCVQQTGDGGFIISGSSDSSGDNAWDVYLVKTDSDGNKIWENIFGGIGTDIGKSVQQTGDGGYIVAGDASSPEAGIVDIYLIKTDASGKRLWEKKIDKSTWDMGCSVQQTSDGGYVIAGVVNFAGSNKGDAYLLKTDSAGNEIWEKALGGSSLDEGKSVQQTRDGGYIVAGNTHIPSSDKTEVYLVKLGPTGPGVPKPGPGVKVLVNGQPLYSLEVPPVIKDGRLLVPVRAVSEALLAEVYWDSGSRIVVVSREGEVVKFRIDDTAVYSRHGAFNLDVPAQILDGRTMVPLRFVSEFFGARIDWDEAELTARITLLPGKVAHGYSYDQLMRELAVGAINRTVNRLRYDVSMSGRFSPELVSRMKRGLEEGWGIKNGDDALRILNWLRGEGHRKKYDQQAEEVSRAGDQFDQLLKPYRQIFDTREINRLQFVKDHQEQLKGKSLVGWDYCRLVNVAQDCYVVGYISQDQAWKETINATKIIQETFTSWEDMANNYLLGREYWSGISDQRFSEAAKWLLADPESPWVKYKWDMPLDTIKN